MQQTIKLLAGCSLSLFFISASQVANSRTTLFSKSKIYYFKTIKKKAIKIKFKKNRDGYLVNQKCFDLKNCKALSFIKNAKKISSKLEIHKNGYVKNPLSLSCSKANGRPFILEDFYLNEYDFCMFKDKSVILSQDLYKAILK